MIKQRNKAVCGEGSEEKDRGGGIFLNNPNRRTGMNRNWIILLSCLSILLSSCRAFAISVGDRVKVPGPMNLNVRATAAGNFLGTQSPGSQGVTIGGPIAAPFSGTPYTWWNVNFDSGQDGWVVEDGLIVVLLASPTLTGPANGALGVSTTPTLSWNAVAGANRYWLTLSTSAGDLPTDPAAFACAKCVETGLSGNTGSTSYTPPTAFPHDGTTRTLSPNTTYYWRVQAYVLNGVQGQFSEVRSFTTAAALLPAPTLTGPPSAATGVSTTPTFSWNGVSGADRYWLTLSTSASDLPTDPAAKSCAGCVDKGLSGNTGSTSYTPPNAFPHNGTTRTLSPNTTYYWRVQGYVPNGVQGQFSEVRSFTTANPASYTITVLASPSAGGTVSGGGTFQLGSSRTVTAAANAGYTFANWTESGNVVSSSSSFSFTLNGNRNLVANFTGAGQRLVGKKIGVDPGHGGTENGASGPNNLKEKSVNLATALALKGYLEAEGATVYMSRTEDIRLTPEQRYGVFVNNNVDMGISVHHNSASPTANTTMVFVYCGLAPSRGSLASKVVQRLATSTGLQVAPRPAGGCEPGNCTACNPDNLDWTTGIPGVGQADMFMVRDPETRGSIPSILAEVSFISNPTEAVKLTDPDYLDKNGWAIYAGVADYYGFEPAPRSGSVPPAIVLYTITSSPPGLLVIVDGASAPTPAQFSWEVGSKHLVSAIDRQFSEDQGTRYTFTSWSDGGSQQHEVTLTSPGTLSFAVATQYLLDLNAAPLASGTFEVSPASEPWFDPGTEVRIIATPVDGHEFLEWEGVDEADANTSWVTMSQPRSVTGHFEPLVSIPEPPTDVDASDASFTDRIRVTWNASIDAAEYEVWRGLDSDPVAATLVGTTPSLSFDDTGMLSGKEYWYWVKAKNSAGASGYSNFDIGSLEVKAPEAPTGVLASDDDFDDRIRITWNASAGAEGYEVWRGLQEGIGFLGPIIGTPAATTFDDTDVQPGIVYWYSITARNSAGRGGYSDFDHGRVRSVVPLTADLEVTESASLSPNSTEMEYVHEMTVHNKGPGQAVNVVVTARLDVSLRFLGSEEPDGVPKGIPNTKDPSVRFEIAAIEANQPVTLKVRLRPAMYGGERFQAEVTSATPDPNPANNRAAHLAPLRARDLREVNAFALKTDALAYDRATGRLYFSAPTTTAEGGSALFWADPKEKTTKYSKGGEVKEVTLLAAPISQFAMHPRGGRMYFLAGDKAIGHNTSADVTTQGFDVKDSTLRALHDLDLSPHPAEDYLAIAYENGLALYHNGTRVQTISPFPRSALSWNAGGLILWAANYNLPKLHRILFKPGTPLPLTSSLATRQFGMEGSASLQAAGGMLFDNIGLVLSETATHLAPGSFGDRLSPGLVAVSQEKKAIYSLYAQGGIWRLRAFLLNGFQFHKEIVFQTFDAKSGKWKSSLPGVPTDLVLWGDEGIAFRVVPRGVYTVRVNLPDELDEPTVSIANSKDRTSEGIAKLNVWLSRQSSSEVSVEVTFRDGSANVDLDYTPPSSHPQIVRFAPLVTKKVIGVRIEPNVPSEGIEEFYAELSSPTNAKLGLRTATITILDSMPLRAFGLSLPTDLSTDLRIQAISVEDGMAEVEIDSGVGGRFQIEYAEDLSGDGWRPIGDVVELAGGPVHMVVELPEGAAQGFLRVARRP